MTSKAASERLSEAKFLQERWQISTDDKLWQCLWVPPVPRSLWLCEICENLFVPSPGAILLKIEAKFRLLSTHQANKNTVRLHLEFNLNTSSSFCLSLRFVPSPFLGRIAPLVEPEDAGKAVQTLGKSLLGNGGARQITLIRLPTAFCSSPIPANNSRKLSTFGPCLLEEGCPLMEAQSYCKISKKFPPTRWWWWWVGWNKVNSRSNNGFRLRDPVDFKGGGELPVWATFVFINFIECYKCRNLF